MSIKNKINIPSLGLLALLIIFLYPFYCPLISKFTGYSLGELYTFGFPKNEFIIMWIALGGVIGFVSNIRLMQKRIGNHDKHLTNTRFSSGIELLGNPNESTRIGGAFNLFFLAEKFPDEFLTPVCEILCAHIRTITSEKSYQKKFRNRPSNETQTIIDLLLKKNKKNKLIFDNCNKNFIGAFLCEINLDSAILNNINFYKATLCNVDFSDAIVNNVNFNYASLTDVLFREAKLSNVYFKNAQLDKADFNNASLNDVEFNDSTLNNLYFSHACLVKVYFSDAVLNNVDFSKSTLSNCYFIKAGLSNIYFSVAVLNKVFFNNATLTNGDFNDATLSSVDFRYAALNNVSFVSADLNEVNFWTGNEIKEVNFRGTKLEKYSIKQITNKGFSIEKTNPAPQHKGRMLAGNATRIDGQKQNLPTIYVND